MAFKEWLLHESSLHSLLTHGNKDIYIILIQRFLRMFAFGGAALVLAIFLRLTGIEWAGVGAFMTMTLLGDGVISYVLTITADKIGRRRVLMIGSLLMTFAGIIFSFSKNYFLLLFGAIFGVISPGAHEVGPFRALEESILAQLTPIEARTDVYAWFAVASTLGMAGGLCVSGWLTYVMREYGGWDWKETYPAVFVLYTVLGLVKAGLTFLLSDRCEPDYDRQTEIDVAEQEATAPLMSSGGRRTSYTKPARVTTTMGRIGGTVTTKLSPESKAILIKLCCLFAVNSFASGMVPVTLMSWYASWWFRSYLVKHIGYAMAGVWLCASVANLFSASVARRIGLVRAMVFTHLPNAIFLAFMPLAPGYWGFMTLLLLANTFGSMDQAPREAFVAAVFLPSERTYVMGTINLVKTIASAGGPLLSGMFWHHKWWSATFVVAGALKICYDCGLLFMFLNTKLPEHSRRPREGTTVADADVGILLSDSLHPIIEDDMEEEYVGDNDGHGKATYEHIEDA